MSFSALMDRGRQTLVVYSAVPRANARGTVDFYPDHDNPLSIKVTTSEERSRIADLPGQVEVEMIRVVSRSFPRGVEHTWSKVQLDGNEYDLSEPIRETVGPSRALNHFEFMLRSRANLDAGDFEEPRAVPVITRDTR